MNDIRKQIQSALASKTCVGLLHALGYHSNRTGLNFANFADFQEIFPIEIDDFADVPQLLFQLTWEDFFAFSEGPKRVDNTIMESYLFFAIQLKQSHYSRTALAKMTRDLNRFANQPVMVIFTYREFLTLSIINRRLHQRDENRDVLEKVTLIKDISVTNPHRAHLDILAELSYDRLQEDRKIDNFVALHEAWQQVLDTRRLNKQFYQELAVLFTRLVGGERGKGKQLVKEAGLLKLPSITDEKIRKEFAVRLLGRLLFCWFLQKKTSASGLSLVPEAILSVHSVTTPRDIDFYHAVLEPLFFETLNKPLAERQPSFQTGDWAAIPFLNGGLFEPHAHDFYDGSCTLNTLIVPDNWLTELLKCFERYHFTIEENTPIEVQVAIDPEMLGQIFENLLAEINPETGETARKATGSYYTPREIVDYMVTASLKYFLHGQTQIRLEKLDSLLSYQTSEVTLSLEEKQAILPALEHLKILDPACGSGAFPMGILQKVMLLLQRVDPDCQQWLANLLAGISDTTARRFMQEKLKGEKALWDYTRKLGILRECIYGVDIQPIAVEISRLRCFLSLMVEENITDTEENRGILPLPNLAFKLVCANTLLGISQLDWQLYEPQTRQEVALLGQLRGEYLNSQGAAKMQLQVQFKAVQKSLLDKVLQWAGKNSEASQLATWKPFEDESCPWFDPVWMFGVKEGFDVVIGNPPYVFARNSQKKGLSVQDKEYFYDHFELAEYQVNLYPLFIEKGHYFLREKGLLSYITPNNWLTINTNKKLRKFVLAQSEIQIVNFYAQVFESAAVDSAILIFKKGSDHPRVTLLEYTDGFKLVKQSSPSYFLTQKDFLINIESFKNVEGMSLIEKMESCATPLSSMADVKAGLKAYEVGKGNPPQTKEMKEDRIYHTHTRMDDSYLKYLDGKDVCRYYLAWSGEFLKYGDNLAAPRTDFRLFSTKRILVRQIPSKPPYCINACLTEEIALNDMNSMNVLKFKESKESPELILAILNSKLISYWFVHKFGKMQRGTFPQFKVNELAIFPIPKTFEQYREVLVNHVTEILAAKRNDPAADTIVLEHDIDRLVYQLYGLSEEEIRMVEGK
jgi:23S rRNA G2445 N2-methylase RlmL